ncbi:hypothetical protein [Xanthobacter aminoxidans]|uniref:hypothetical protein n=1 Tax=Xanthobacter aminoxidans TaxID=186280 RepID=UPI002022CADF|nr:hypothetical protein [Xanthobacter aminoxidans]MCL8384166.1 hypothetical protein [Xanthobacter aminoxidans]
MEASPPVSVPGSAPDWEPYNSCLGIGSAYSVSNEERRRLPKKPPIGFVHFPDPKPDNNSKD